jgi:hypothetical protein
MNMPTLSQVPRRWASAVVLIGGFSGFVVNEASWTYSQVIGALSAHVGADQLISASLPARPFVEPHLATNSRSPQHLVGAAIMSVRDQTDFSQTRCIALASFDGARTWITHEFSVAGCNDPWVAILDDGTAIFIGLEIKDRRVVHLWLFRSPDGGRTWSTMPHSFGPDHDHATLTVDRTGGKFHGALYVASTHFPRDVLGNTVFIARSMDGGKSFRQVTDHEVMNLNYNTMTPVVLPDGALLVPLRAHQRLVPDKRDAVSLRNGLYWVVRSDDGGARFGVPTLITDACTGGGAGFPSLAVDLSNGPRRGRAYALCHDGLKSGPSVMHSDDGGKRWSDPVQVPKTAPVDAEGQRRVSSIATNRDGDVAVSWHDRGPDASSTCWDVFVAFSGDGGDSFTDAYKVSTAPSCPAASDNGWTAQRWSFGGEYSGLAAAADGTFHLLWPDSRAKRYELRTAQVRVTR